MQPLRKLQLISNHDPAKSQTSSLFDISAVQLLTVKEIARMLNVPEKTVRNWVFRGFIKSIKLGPRLIRFKKEDIELWISKLNGEFHGN